MNHETQSDGRKRQTHLTHAMKLEPRTIMVMALLALVQSGCTPPEPEARAPSVRPAKLLTLTASSDMRNFDFPAVIEADETSELAFQVNGRLQEIAVTEAQELNQGDIVAKLDPRKYENEVFAAQTDFDNANLEYQRAKRLIAADAISRSVLEQRKAKREVARAKLDTANKAMEDTILRAPFSGVVAAVHPDLYQNIQPNDSIITLQSTGAGKAVVQIPATLVAQSDRIQPVSTRLTLDVADVSMPATLSTTALTGDTQSQTFEVSFAFTPPTGLVVLPGMTGTISVQLQIEGSTKGTESQLTVPLNSIVSDGSSTYVWVVNDRAMTVARRDIKLANGVGESLAVTEGLRVGETIVAAGAAYLSEGAKIRRYKPKATASEEQGAIQPIENGLAQ